MGETIIMKVVFPEQGKNLIHCIPDLLTPAISPNVETRLHNLWWWGTVFDPPLEKNNTISPVQTGQSCSILFRAKIPSIIVVFESTV